MITEEQKRAETTHDGTQRTLTTRYPESSRRRVSEWPGKNIGGKSGESERKRETESKYLFLIRRRSDGPRLFHTELMLNHD
mmetsp:Transcript_3003/g.6472  ORF Transcript_3003/g.6472 Transcript_3003/m.6472 type:complete len:81 (+) Transcript_3003:146-388(+)